MLPTYHPDMLFRHRVCMNKPSHSERAACAGVRCESSSDATRRTLFLTAAAAAVIASRPRQCCAQEGQQAVQMLRVNCGQQGDYSSIQAAVAAASPGSILLVGPGSYRERIILSKPLQIRAHPEGAAVEVVWNSSQPYESVVEATAEGATLKGVALRHNSKSVANNYAVFIRGGNLKLEGCDISSSSGSGIGVEGACPSIQGCRIHSCARHGVALFGALEEVGEGLTGGELLGCVVEGNRGTGVLVRDGAAPALRGNTVRRNGVYGVMLQDCGGVYVDNSIQGNARGSIGLDPLMLQPAASELDQCNELDVPTTYL